MNKIVSPRFLDSKTSSKLFDDVPKPDRAEWEKSLKALKPWLSPEKYAETEEIHWRMFERANRWHGTKARNPVAQPPAVPAARFPSSRVEPLSGQPSSVESSKAQSPQAEPLDVQPGPLNAGSSSSDSSDARSSVIPSLRITAPKIPPPRF